MPPPFNTSPNFELHPHKPALFPWELAQLEQLAANFTWVSFNGLNYDIPMIRLALTGPGVHVLKHANDRIIVGGLKRWDFGKEYAQHGMQIDHIDIMEVTPGVRIGLKTYMARYHAKTIQELPFDPAAPVPEHEQAVAIAYCGNDLIGTRELREIITKRLSLREKLSEKLGVDLRSKSDAQMSEAIIAAKLGYRPEVPYIPTGYNFKLHVAPWLSFVTPHMHQVFELCKSVTFTWSRNEDGDPIEDDQGNKIKTGVSLPQELKRLIVTIGRTNYKFGIGGLHSQESAQSLYTIDGVQSLSDHDVGSFYPSLAILLKLFGPEIMAIYAEIYAERMASKGKIKAAKASNDPALGDIETLADGFKIVLNGGYGKLWSKYSFLADPNAGIAITLNGQLSLLMLIERLELGGVRVVSANTDGIVLLTPAGLEWYRDSTISWWQSVTGLTTDATFYRSIHSRDVNSYVAIKMDGEVKRKGCFSPSGILSSMQGVHPDRDISKTAAVQFLLNGTPVADTVRACRDVRELILAKSVKGGGQWRGQYLGKTVRWYLSTQGEPIHYISNGNKVAGSAGAVPVQTLPDAFPDDVDYQSYIDHANKLLSGAGVVCSTQ